MRLILCTCVFALSTSPVVRAQEQGAVDSTAFVQAAMEVAVEWLALVDGDKYDESWEQASELVRDAVTREQWQASVRQVHERFGMPTERTLLTARYTTSLPNAPPGEYVLIEYRIGVSDGGTMTETVVPMLDVDGRWRVSGWSLRP